MGTLLYGTDAVCMALLAISTDKWEGTSRAETVDAAVMIIQIVTLAGKWQVVEKGLAKHERVLGGAFGHVLSRSQATAQRARTRWQPCRAVTDLGVGGISGTMKE